MYAKYFSAIGQIHTDQSGPFLVPSVSGNKYVFVFYDYDSNYIEAVGIPSRTKNQLIKAYRATVTKL